ncbi:hypothetical protein DITRI_Ditri06bG0056500 [Diplodiscus trichospermus]
MMSRDNNMGRWSSGANGGDADDDSGSDDDYSDEISGSNMPLSPSFSNPALFSLFIAMASILFLDITPLSSML